MTINKKQIEKFINDIESGDGDFFTHLYKDKFLYDAQSDGWMAFAGHNWKPTHERAMFSFVEPLAKGYESLLSAGITFEKIYKFYKRRINHLRTTSGINSCLRLASGKLLYQGEWNTTPHLLPAQNGIINLKTGELRDGKPTDYFNFSIPTTYEKNAKAPRFEQFLQEIFPNDQEVIDFMQRLFGYGLLGESTEHILPVLCGATGFNGKDTLLKAVSATLGDISGTVSSDIFIDSKSGTNALVAAHQLKNLHIAYTSESAREATLSSERVKHLTGNSPIAVKQLYKDLYTIKPKYLLLLLTNFAPQADAIDDALWDRIVLVPFEQRFTDDPILENEHPIDTQLDTKLKQEAPGILAWLVRGCVEYHKTGLNVPDKLKLSTIAYREQNDALLTFISEECETSPDYWIKTSDLQNAFKEFCGENNHKNLTAREVKKKLSTLGYKYKRTTKNNTTIRIYEGLRLKPTIFDTPGEQVALEEFLELNHKK